MVKKLLLRLAQIELVLLFLVVMAGSIVRMTDSGMGCPDWPKCFGYLIPPTEQSQVLWAPEKEFKKGQMIVYQESLWVSKEDFTAGSSYDSDHWDKYILHDYAVFNPFHTWVEYINRLLGALSGVPMVLMFFLSIPLVVKKPLYLLFSSLGLFGLGFEAWLGKVVVDGNLVPHQITYHMLGALFLIALIVTFIFSLQKEQQDKLPYRPALPKRSGTFIMVLVLLLLSQIIMGTQIREQIDLLHKTLSPRSLWIEQLDIVFYIHRSFSLVLVLSTLFLAWSWRQREVVIKAFDGVVIIMLVSVLSGAIMAYMGVPKWLQPTHLFLSIVMFGLLWYVGLKLIFQKRPEPQSNTSLTEESTIH